MSTVVSKKLEMSTVETNWKCLVRTGKLDRLNFIFWERVHCNIHYLQYNCARICDFLGNHSPARSYCSARFNINGYIQGQKVRERERNRNAFLCPMISSYRQQYPLLPRNKPTLKQVHAGSRRLTQARAGPRKN